jgi:hypothetical protein
MRDRVFKSWRRHHVLGEVGAGSTEDKGAELFACFSSRVGDGLSLSALPSVLSRSESEAISMVVSPVLQIMPKLQEVCACPSLPLSGSI